MRYDKVITIFKQNGGVGKTTISLILEVIVSEQCQYDAILKVLILFLPIIIC